MADKMARADLPLRGGQSTKNASDTAAGAGGRSTAPSWCRSHWPGRAVRAGDGFPAHRRWRCACLGPAPSPRHSELRQVAPRALSRVALLPGGRAACSPRLAEPQPRRIDATRGQRRCPKVSGGRRGAAGWPPSRRTRPFSLVGWATGSPCGATWGVSACPPGAVAATYVPGGQPARCTCRSDPPRPASAPAGHTAAARRLRVTQLAPRRASACVPTRKRACYMYNSTSHAAQSGGSVLHRENAELGNPR